MLKSLVAAGFVLGLVTSTSQAAPFTGNVSFALATLPSIVATGGGTATSCGACGDLTIVPVAWGVTMTNITLSPTAANPLSALSGTLVNPACTFDGMGGNGGGVGGACGLGGTINALVNGQPFLVVPLAVLGQNGRLTFGQFGSWIDGQAWTTGTATATINGAPVAGGTMVGYDNRALNGVGTIQLVAPGGLMSTLGGAFPLLVSMTITVVPEPATLMLLGSGVLGLAVLGHRRRRQA
jgi:hypothetical protein